MKKSSDQGMMGTFTISDEVFKTKFETKFILTIILTIYFIFYAYKLLSRYKTSYLKTEGL